MCVLSVELRPEDLPCLTDINAKRNTMATFAHNYLYMANRNEKGQYEKGHEKAGGMKKGYESPIKKEFREMMADFSRENFLNFCEAMKDCEPRDFCRFYLESLKFNLPMLQSVTLENTKGIANDLTERLRNLANGKD